MASTIDPTCNGQLTTRGVNVQKSEVQQQFQAAVTDIETLQTDKADATDVTTNANDITTINNKLGTELTTYDITITVPTDMTLGEAITVVNSQLAFSNVAISVSGTITATTAGYTVHVPLTKTLTISGGTINLPASMTSFMTVTGPGTLNFLSGLDFTSADSGLLDVFVIGTTTDGIRQGCFKAGGTWTGNSNAPERFIDAENSHIILSGLTINSPKGSKGIRMRNTYLEATTTSTINNTNAATQGTGIEMSDGSIIATPGAPTFRVDKWDRGIDMFMGAICDISSSQAQVTNCTTGIRARYGCIANVNGATFTGNTANSSPAFDTTGNANSLVQNTLIT